MANILVQCFAEALKRIPSAALPSGQELPQHPHPEQERFDPAGCAEDDDQITHVDKEGWRREEITEKRTCKKPVGEKDRGHLDDGRRKVGIELYAFYKSRRYLYDPPYAGK